MKRFKFRYSAVVLILLLLVIVLMGVGLYFNIYNAVISIKESTTKFISHLLISLLSLLLIAFSISVLISSKYLIKNGNLFVYFGFIKNKVDVNEIVEITHFKKSNKLVIYFSDQTYTVIVISPEDYDDFVLAVREENKKIYFDTKIDGEDTPD